ncbi:hypothetical protein [Variovorax ginsengisoli]|uniref:Uncharacterized protein n=1 Tax=Variovorax ginsengisoli TaxID=363844 RepID=A0ABT9S851_9BURK|nr:hypothetical protein [Variovorax ginsengisoli]MDP9900048.1 hypothetical protein [Variovorax ginsengisoli]
MHLTTVPARRRSPALFVVLALAVWLAATLGLMHQTMHVPGLKAAAAAARGGAPVTASPSGDASHPAPAAHGVLALFGGHHSEADCRLYDQLAHGSAMPSVPFVALPVFLPAATFAWFEGEVLARWVALFDARGPPFSR